MGSSLTVPSASQHHHTKKSETKQNTQTPKSKRGNRPRSSLIMDLRLWFHNTASFFRWSSPISASSVQISFLSCKADSFFNFPTSFFFSVIYLMVFVLGMWIGLFWYLGLSLWPPFWFFYIYFGGDKDWTFPGGLWFCCYFYLVWILFGVYCWISVLVCLWYI